MSTPDKLTDHVNHVYESSPQRDLLLKMAAKIEALESQWFRGRRPEPVATPTPPPVAVTTPAIAPRVTSTKPLEKK